MTAATPFFPLAPEHRDLAIVGLAQAGTPARTIADAVEVELLTVCEVLNSASIQPFLPPRTFRIEAIEWDTDGEVIERLPSRGTITVDDWKHFDEEGAQRQAVSQFEDLHGYCLVSSRVTEVPGAAWPTTPQEAEGLVQSAQRMGQLRMGNGRYSLVDHETLAFCYPKHLAFIQNKIGPSYSDFAEEWSFLIIDTQDTEGFWMMTNNLVDISAPLAHEHGANGEQNASDVIKSVLVALGREHLQKKRRTFLFDGIEWVGKWKKTRHLPTRALAVLVEFEDRPLDNDAVYKAGIHALARKHGAEIKGCVMVLEVTCD